MAVRVRRGRGRAERDDDDPGEQRTAARPRRRGLRQRRAGPVAGGFTDYHRLLPDVWKQSHPEAIREYRVEERRDKAERKQLQAARRRLAARCRD